MSAALGAYVLWGIVPIYWPLLDRSSAVEILAHRIIWSAVLGAILVAIFARQRWRAQVSGRGTFIRLALASAVISLNWGVYIWSVNNDRVTEAALGYYINPLLAIMAGVVLFKEKLAPVQWGAIGLAASAVVVITIEYGQPPWAALVLAVSFTIYGVIKKRVRVEPMVSMTAESLLMMLPSLAFLIYLASVGQGTFGRLGVGYDLLLMGSGVVTAIPLLLFATAAQRIPLTLLGLTQYLAPTLQFLLGVFYFGEAMTPGRWVGFSLVWLALVIISVQAVITARKSRRRSWGPHPPAHKLRSVTIAPAFQFSDFDRDIHPGDDLFRHVNGTWLTTVEIDADKPGAGAFITLRDEAEEAVRDIITGLSGDPGSDAARIADLYASFMDTARIEQLGVRPLTPWLDQVDQVTTTADVSRLLGTWLGLGVRSVLGFGSDADPGDPERALLFTGQSGLGLPDESYYREEQHAEILAEYAAHVQRTFALLGVADPAGAAARVVKLETAIAAVHWDKVRTRDLQQMYNLQSWAQFTAAAPGIDWAVFVAAAGIPEAALGEVVNAQPSFVSGLAELVTTDRLEQWQDWARFTLVSSPSPYLAEAFVAERFHFYGTVLSGVPVNRDRWKRGVALVEGGLGDAVGRIYVEQHFSPHAKDRMDGLVANLIEAYRQSITELEWMTQETRAEALRKLSRFTPKIGFPDKWKDYSSLSIDRSDLIGNVIASNRFDLDEEIRKALKPVDRTEWFMTPQTVNAYYHPLRNEIVFPAAILQPPFFNDAADDAVNYGAIGAVIGHEIGHGFDDQGSTCDGDGRLRNWWTDADRTAFTDRTKQLIEQYAVLSPEGADGQLVNGELTIGENIGDLGGLGIALKAWQIATAGTQVPEVDGLTGEQRLFLSWAAVWQAKYRPETVKQRLATDPHSPNEFRCNQIVRNVDAFYDAFDVTPEHALWLAPQERVTIW